MGTNRATPPHRQNQLQRCTWGIQTGVRNGKLYGAGVTCVKRGSVSALHLQQLVRSKQPFKKIYGAGDNAANKQQQQNSRAEHCQLEFSITLLVRRR